MDQSLQKYYEEQFSMFATQGWKEFHEHFQSLFEQVDTLSGVDSTEKLFFRQGQLDILRLVSNWPQYVEQAYKDNEANETNL